MKKTLSILIICGVLLPALSFGQDVSPVKVPENLEEAKELGQKALETGQKELPGLIEKIWKEEIMPLWQKMYDWFKANIWPKIKSWFMKFIQPEIEKRKPALEEEFKKEKQEMKTEVQNQLPKIWDSLWEKFKELIATD